MDRLKKRKLNIHIDPILYDELEKLSLHTGISKGKLISYASQKLIDDLKNYKVSIAWIDGYKPEDYYPKDIEPNSI